MKVDFFIRNFNNEYFIDFLVLSNSIIELYVEVLDYSIFLNDIVVEVFYKDKIDRVLVIVFWVEMNMVYLNIFGLF